METTFNRWALWDKLEETVDCDDSGNPHLFETKREASAYARDAYDLEEWSKHLEPVGATLTIQVPLS